MQSIHYPHLPGDVVASTWNCFHRVSNVCPLTVKVVQPSCRVAFFLWSLMLWRCLVCPVTTPWFGCMLEVNSLIWLHARGQFLFLDVYWRSIPWFGCVLEVNSLIRMLARGQLLDLDAGHNCIPVLFFFNWMPTNNIKIWRSWLRNLDNCHPV